MESIPFPNKKYQIIYADPPWGYNGRMFGKGGGRAATDHYPTMKIDDIANLKVNEISADNSVLFMWVTLPKLNQFMHVVNSWGFKYKTTAFTWVKFNPKTNKYFYGLGRWTRANPEIMILATKGKVRRINSGISNLQLHPLEGHSKKPDIFRKLIIDLVGDLPRIELFARQKTEGWDVWGNEV